MQTKSLSFEQLCELFNYTPKNRPLSSREYYSERDVLFWLASGARTSTSQRPDHVAMTRAPWLSAEQQTS